MAGSTLPRRAVGRILRDLRTRSNTSQLSAGLAIEVSPQTIGRFEDGQPCRISTPLVAVLLDLYRADDDDRRSVLGLLHEVKAAKGDPAGGWWRAYADLVAPHFDHYMSLEEACSGLTTFRLATFPGLLQTGEYRRAMSIVADPVLSKVDVERRLELAERRQRRLSDETFIVEVVLSEAVLRNRVGSPAVMAEQLRIVARAAERPNVSVRVIPADTDGHVGLIVGDFILFEFPKLKYAKLTEPPVVYVEGFTGALFLEDNRVIERYKEAASNARAAALDEEDTRRLVLAIAEEYEP